jgi:hypothetical protein
MYELSMLDRSQSSQLAAALRGPGNRSYWSRQWILQEILMARQLVICCGSRGCCWIKFSMIMEPSWHKTSLTKYWNKNLRNCSAVPLLRSWMLQTESGERHSLRTLFWEHLPSKCADGRDKIYALINLAYEDTRICVDYSLSVVEVVTNALQSFNEPISVHDFDRLLVFFEISAKEAFHWLSSRTPSKRLILDREPVCTWDWDAPKMVQEIVSVAENFARLACRHKPLNRPDFVLFGWRSRHTEFFCLEPGPEGNICDCNNCITGRQSCNPRLDFSAIRDFISSDCQYYEVQVDHLHIKQILRKSFTEPDKLCYFGSIAWAKGSEVWVMFWDASLAHVTCNWGYWLDFGFTLTQLQYAHTHVEALSQWRQYDANDLCKCGELAAPWSRSLIHLEGAQKGPE